MTADSYNINIFSFPGAAVEPLEDTPLITNLRFLSLSRTRNPVPGVLADSIEFGGFKISWEVYFFTQFSNHVPVSHVSIQGYEFLAFVVTVSVHHEHSFERETMPIRF